MENKKVGCALLIMALCEENNVNRSKWVKDWIMNRKKNSHINLVKELHETEPMDFQNYFRMSSANYKYLLRLVAPLIERKNTHFREAISVHERLAVTLRFLATGRNFADLSYSSVMGKSTVGQIVIETCEALNEVLKEFIQLPKSSAEWQRQAMQWDKKWNFPHALGSIDGKHISIRKPANSGSLYYNYKHFFSIVLMAVVNANYEFIMVDIGANGRVSDGGVIFYTNFWQNFINGQLNLPDPAALPGVAQTAPFVFIGDDAFALSKNLLKPYSLANLTLEQKIFNYRLSRARRTVENAFGMLSSRFGVLQKPMSLQPEKASIVTMTCCYLHNFLIKHNKKEYAPRSLLNNETVPNAVGANNLISLQSTRSNSVGTDAKKVREIFCKYFNNEGQVPWQWNNVK